MKPSIKFTVWSLLAVMAVAIFSPTLVSADQNSKNTWRNLAIGSGVVAGYGLLHHNGTATVLGAAGAAYSLNRYEQDRHHQSQERDARRRAYYRHHHHHHYN